MKIFKKQIPVRHILYVVLGWLHATMLCVPLYALVLNFVSEGMTKDVILQNILRGFLILCPHRTQLVRNKMPAPHLFLYSRKHRHHGTHRLPVRFRSHGRRRAVHLLHAALRPPGTAKATLCLTTPAMPGLAVFAVPFLCSVFTDRARFDFPARLPRFRGRLLRAVPHAARHPPYR